MRGEKRRGVEEGKLKNRRKNVGEMQSAIKDNKKEKDGQGEKGGEEKNEE